MACLTGCGGTLDGDAVAEEAANVLTEQVGARPEVACPDGLEEEVGAETRCTATVDGQTYGVTVTVTALDDESADFDVVVDRQPQG
jgi:hypothetical protein